MQSDCNSFCGDVYSDSFIEAIRDEDNFLDQILKQICSDYFHDELISILLYENAYLINSSIKTHIV